MAAPSPNAPLRFFKGRPSTYTVYVHKTVLRNDLDKPEPAILYEFEHGLSQCRFTVLSLVAQKGNRVFVLNGSARSYEFEQFRPQFEAILNTFHIT